MTQQSELVTLVKPTVELANAYNAMVEDSIVNGEGYPYNNIDLARSDFGAFVRELDAEAHGIGLPPGIPPQETYLLYRNDGTVLGEIRFRPSLTPPYAAHNGHIGYNIRPSERGKGYATRQLGLLLEIARQAGLIGVMLTIEGQNPASARVIEAHGGTSIRQCIDPESATPVTCYWIDLRQSDSIDEGSAQP